MSSRSLRFAALGVALSTAALAPSSGQACDSSSCLLVTRGQNGLLPKGALRIDISYRRTPMTSLRQGGASAEQVLRPKVDFENRRLLPAFHDELGGFDDFVQLDVAYGLSPRASVLLSMPIVAHRAFDIGHPPVVRETYTTTGNGDALLGLRYQLHQGQADSLVGGLSVELPAGASRLESPGGRADRGVLDPMLQPGSGSLDLVGVLQYTRRLGGVDVTAAASYQANGTNGLDHRFGNDAIASLSLGRPLFGPVAGSVQVKGAATGRSQFMGEPLASTGGRFVYVIPGLSVKAMRQVSLYGYAVVPVYRYVNEAQLAPRVGLVVGASRTF